MERRLRLSRRFPYHADARCRKASARRDIHDGIVESETASVNARHPSSFSLTPGSSSVKLVLDEPKKWPDPNMSAQGALPIDKNVLEKFCRRHHIRRLSLFGSAARGELRPESDLDFLVEYDPAHRPHLVALQEIEDELSQLCGGRKVDLVNPKYLNPRLHERVLREAQLQYGEG